MAALPYVAPAFRQHSDDCSSISSRGPGPRHDPCTSVASLGLGPALGNCTLAGAAQQACLNRPPELDWVGVPWPKARSRNNGRSSSSGTLTSPWLCCSSSSACSSHAPQASFISCSFVFSSCRATCPQVIV
ncbi:hypothetical protein HPB50_020175 [Hyalomma asiaticum]|uniref:Uncharacterized protein n=1 Tax=Hyalomma asiaticum TaxID=266040 RepID=A0ACB7TN61_HYAAI|nr:hypothetical protein HPB50_020175 [Hyalomma asiaticum]